MSGMNLGRLLRKAEIEELFHREADLLDQRQFEEWLDLLTDDFTYTMPLRLNVKFGEHAERENTRAGSEVLWFDEDKELLVKRVQQIMTGTHWAEEPFSRIAHLMTNIRLVSVEENAAVVSSRFLVYRNRVEDEVDILVGRRSDHVVRRNDAWQFSKREILLDQNVLLAKNLTMFF